MIRTSVEMKKNERLLFLFVKVRLRRKRSEKFIAKGASSIPRLVLVLIASILGGAIVPASAESSKASDLKTGTHDKMIVGMAAKTEKENRVPAPFYEALRKPLKKRKLKVESICNTSDGVAERILDRKSTRLNSSHL